MEREWETTLRNTFGVPMEAEVKVQQADPEKGSVVGANIITSKIAPVTNVGGGDVAEDETSARRSVMIRDGSRSRRSLSWPLGRGMATLTGDVYSCERNSRARASAASSINSSTGRSIRSNDNNDNDNNNDHDHNHNQDRRRTSGLLAVDASFLYDNDDDDGGEKSPTSVSGLRRGGDRSSTSVARPQVSYLRGVWES